MKKAERIFNETYTECRLWIKKHGYEENCGFASLFYKETECVCKRTCNAIQKWIDRERYDIKLSLNLEVITQERFEFLNNALDMVQKTLENNLELIEGKKEENEEAKAETTAETVESKAVEAEEAVETVESSLERKESKVMTHQQYMIMILALKTIIKNDTEGYTDCYGKIHNGHTDLSVEYKISEGYTKSLISNWSNYHPVKYSAFNCFVTDEIINLAVSEKYITIPKYKGFSQYKEEVIKLTAKGKRHLLKALTE